MDPAPESLATLYLMPGWPTFILKGPAGAGVITGPDPAGCVSSPTERRPVAIEPQDPGAGWAAADGGNLRASDADRERVIDALKAAFVQGQLSRSELTRRTGQALASRTYADLGSATAGIPPRRAAAAPPRQAVAPARTRPVSWKAVAWVVGVFVVLPGLGYAFFETRYGSLYIMLLLAFAAAAGTGMPGPGDGRNHVY